MFDSYLSHYIYYSIYYANYVKYPLVYLNYIYLLQSISEPWQPPINTTLAATMAYPLGICFGRFEVMDAEEKQGLCSER